MPLRPCLTCGRPCSGPRCPAHTLRNGSTRSWRRIRAQILARDGHRCVICGQPATDVDHVTRVIDDGTDDPVNLRSLCREHHVQRHADR